MPNSIPKVNKRNGHSGRGGRFARELETLLADLAAIEVVRAGTLRHLREQRRKVYCRAAEYGVNGRTLKAAHALRTKA
jgi:hypothetical protein